MFNIEETEKSLDLLVVPGHRVTKESHQSVNLKKCLLIQRIQIRFRYLTFINHNYQLDEKKYVQKFTLANIRFFLLKLKCLFNRSFDGSQSKLNTQIYCSFCSLNDG